MKNKKQKGITLIALVITIIVMLILVAVTITMAVNGGLFEYAGKAGTKTNEAIANEQLLASGQVTIDNKVYSSIDEYLLGDGKAILSDDYGHKYTVEEPGRYYFYSYTYGQNFMTLFEVTEENNKLIANKLGVYSNETGVSREDASAGEWIVAPYGNKAVNWSDAVCLSDPSEITQTQEVYLLYVKSSQEMYGYGFYLVPGYYVSTTSNDNTLYLHVVSENFIANTYEYSQYSGTLPEGATTINLHEFASSGMIY